MQRKSWEYCEILRDSLSDSPLIRLDKPVHSHERVRHKLGIAIRYAPACMLPLCPLLPPRIEG